MQQLLVFSLELAITINFPVELAITELELAMIVNFLVELAFSVDQ
jgi:hypothetical protein